MESLKSDLLTAVIERFRVRPMIYGETDCLQLCAAATAAQVGVDHAAKFPQYTSRDEAMQILHQCGGLRALVESVLGESKHGAAAQRGDIVLIDIGRECCGVCLGRTAVTMSEYGMVSVPRGKRFLAAWSPR